MRKRLAEGIYVAMQMRRPLPVGARDAFVMVEAGCRPTVEELDAMPQSLVDAVLLYGEVRDAIAYGQELTL